MKNSKSLIRPPVGDMNKDEWLHAAYLANMESIHNVYADVRDVKFGYKTEEEAFLRDIREYAGDTSFRSARKAFDKLSREEDFMSREERAVRNLKGMLSGTKVGQKSAMNVLQDLTRDKSGHYQKVDYSKMTWNGSIWIYDGRIGIDFRNSPVEVVISVL